MGLEVYYPQDIRNVLLAAEQASNAALMATGTDDDKFTLGYQAGHRAALATIALAFGLVNSDHPVAFLSARWGRLLDRP